MSVARRNRLVWASRLFASLGLPAVVVVAALTQHHVAWDFHHELYPQAKLMLDGTNPYPGPSHDPATGTNYVWPPVAAYAAAPLTVLPTRSADVVAAALGLLCFYAALWLVGLRDWRVFGLATLWPPVYVELGLSHLTPLLALLAAAAWRFRDRRYESGLLIGAAVAIKLLAWPLVVWLAALGRMRSVVTASAVAALSLTLVLPYTGIGSYADAVLAVSRVFDQDTYTVFALLVQLGAPEAVARGVNLALAGFLLVETWRHRSFTLAIATALIASPIVWLDYFALAAIPLAITRPRLAWVWFVPLATVGLEGAGLEIGDPAGTLRALLAFGVVFAVAFHAERATLDDDSARNPDQRLDASEWRAVRKRSDASSDGRLPRSPQSAGAQRP